LNGHFASAKARKASFETAAFVAPWIAGPGPAKTIIAGREYPYIVMPGRDPGIHDRLFAQRARMTPSANRKRFPRWVNLEGH